MNFSSNPQLQLAFEFVEYTGRNLFLTGRAGTGKTTFLQYIHKNSFKRSVVVAPTGVAAINAGGVTIHSFFQLPFGPILPNDISGTEGSDHGILKFSREKINIIRSLDLLIIDEISMVRADLLDGIDQVLRRFRSRYKPFGGVQLLMIGDLQQLAPVVKELEWEILKPYYESFFFFGSRALQKTDYISLELRHIYRQSDEHFIKLLNQVRENVMDEHTLDLLNQRYQPGLSAASHEGYINLTTHNNQAQQINQLHLNALKARPNHFNARIDGEFPETSFPTDHKLVLKVGAQVMFVKNDPSPEKLFYNGKIGKIADMDDDMVYVECPGEQEHIAVTPLAWENTRYALDDETKEIKENVIGTFTQYPLKLAWAITIHKSQGLTFEKAVIDAQAAFAHGQVYVALSRCKSLEGLILSSRITPDSVKSDRSIYHFTKNIELNQPDKRELDDAKLKFQENLLIEMFDFSILQNRLGYLIKLFKENLSSVEPGIQVIFDKTDHFIKTELASVSEKFGSEINKHLSKYNEIEKNLALQDRIRKACVYFSEKLQAGVMKVFEDAELDSDNKRVKKILNEALQRFELEAEIKYACLEACKSRFTTYTYLEAKAKASIEETKKPAKKVKKVLSETSDHPFLLEQLRKWRDRAAVELKRPIFMILPKLSMVAISNELPGNIQALQSIHGFGKRKVEQYGTDIISLVQDYCMNNNIMPNYEANEGVKSSGRKSKKQETTKLPTKEISFEMFNDGMTIPEIARKRNFATSTIEGHLLEYVDNGLIHPEKFLSADDVSKITESLKRNDGKPLVEVREELENAFSFFELRVVRSYLKRMELA